jgi:hypothetical protein
MERSLIPPPHPIDEVDSVFVVASNMSTAGSTASALTENLQGAEPDKKVFYVEMDSADETANREKLWEQMDKGNDQGYTKPVILAAGGDGTAHYLGKNILHPDAPKYAASALLTPWGLGHENDLFASLHDPKMKGSVGILDHKNGHEIISYPLDVRAVIDDQLVEDIALAYVTLGPSADAAAVLASKRHRRFRQYFPHILHTLVDMTRAAPIVLGRPDVVYAKPDADRPQRPIVEVNFNNSERMAGLGNYSCSTGLGDRAMHYAELRSNHPIEVVRFVARIAMGKPLGERTTGPVGLWFKKGGLHGQIEGELICNKAGKLGAITAIVVKPGDKPIRYYATKKPRIQHK